MVVHHKHLLFNAFGFRTWKDDFLQEDFVKVFKDTYIMEDRFSKVFIQWKNNLISLGYDLADQRAASLQTLLSILEDEW